MSFAFNQFDGDTTTSGSDKEHGYETHAQPSRAEIHRALTLLWPERDRIELRIIHKKPNASGKKPIDSGLFDREHIPALIDAALKSNSLGAVYVNINPIKQNYTPPSLNNLKRGATGLVGNNDIECRKYLPIDLDPIRPTNTSATSAQLEKAKDVAIQIEQYLNEQGWPEPVVSESGNGIHLLYRIDLPNDQGSEALIDGVLGGLGSKFNNQFVKIDKVMKNAGRIIKLYGTVSNKGDNTIETPHRLSRMVRVPVSIQTVTVEQLKQEAASLQQTTEPERLLGPRPAWLTSAVDSTWEISGVPFDLDQFLKRLSIDFKKQIKPDRSEWFHLKHCPFNVSHGEGDSAISRQTNGKLGFKCFHDSCADKNWHSLRALVQSSEQQEPETVTACTPQKLPLALKAVDPLPIQALPIAIRDAVTDMTERVQCPADYLAVAILSAAGTIVGNKIGIYPLANDETWEVYPCLWGGFVGSPGSKKTPALNTAMKPLKHLEEQAGIDYKLAYKTYKAALDKYKIDLEKSKSNRSGPIPVEPVEPKPERFIVNDTTYQALGEILANNPRGVLALSDELSGLLQSLDTAGQEAARGFYLSGWGGASSNSFDRIGRGSIVLPRYCLSVFGGFQPDRIKSYVQSTQGGNSKNDGLVQRFQLLVWPDPYQFESVIDRAPDKAAIDAFNQSMFQLAKMAKAPIPGVNRGRHGETLLHFEPAAQIRFNQWLTNLEKFLAKATIEPARLSHFAKYRSLVPALALLFHLLDGHTGPVSSECLDNAILFSKYLRSHANRVYASISGVDHECTRTLAQRLLNKDLKDGFTCRTVVIKGWSGLTKVTAQSALDALVEFGWLTEVEKRGNGRPTVCYKINEGISAELLEVSMVL
jgi:hypothetical protein